MYMYCQNTTKCFQKNPTILSLTLVPDRVLPRLNILLFPYSCHVIALINSVWQKISQRSGPICLHFNSRPCGLAQFTVLGSFVLHRCSKRDSKLIFGDAGIYNVFFFIFLHSYFLVVLYQSPISVQGVFFKFPSIFAHFSMIFQISKECSLSHKVMIILYCNITISQDLIALLQFIEIICNLLQ